jgi:hypothetical protein
LEEFGDFKIGGQIFHTVKYADDLVLLAKEEKVLQDMIDKPIEIGRCYGMEMNVEKTKVMRIFHDNKYSANAPQNSVLGTSLVLFVLEMKLDTSRKLLRVTALL